MGIPSSYTLVAFSQFYDEILPEIPNYVKSLVDQAIRDACIEFCRRTRLWKETVQVNVVATEASILVTPPSPQAVFMEVRRVAYDGTDLTPFMPEEKDADTPNWREDTGTPENYCVYGDEDKVFLYPIPTESLTNGLEVDGVFAPARSCTQVPSFLYDRHSKVIAKGAKYRLMQMGKKPWTDRELSAKYEREFNNECGGEGMRVAQGATRGPLRTTTVHGVK